MIWLITYMVLAALAAAIFALLNRRPRRCGACGAPLRWKASRDGPIDMWNERADCACGETTWWGP